MDHAIVLAAGPGIGGEDLSQFNNAKVGENPQLIRLLITCQRAGIERFTVIVPPDFDEELREKTENDPRIEADITWHRLGEEKSLGEGTYLVIQSNVVTTPAALASLEKAVGKGEVLALVDVNGTSAVARCERGKVREVIPHSGRMVGVFATDGKTATAALKTQAPARDLVDAALERDSLSVVPFENGYWTLLTEETDSTKKAEDMLFAHVTKSSSGWLSRNIHSKLSIPLSRLLIKTSLTPNMISALIGTIGMLSGLFYILGRPVLGALMLEISTIFDRCDGEVARIKLKETRYGQWVDTIFDQLSFLSFTAGVPIGYWLQSHSTMAVVLGSVNMGLFAFFQVWTFYFLTRYAKSGTMVAYPEKVDKLISYKDRSPLHRFIIKLRPLMKRESFSLVFLVAAILGGYPWVLGLTTLGLGLAFIHQVDDIVKLYRSRKEEAPAADPQKITAP